MEIEIIERIDKTEEKELARIEAVRLASGAEVSMNGMGIDLLALALAILESFVNDPKLKAVSLHAFASYLADKGIRA